MMINSVTNTQIYNVMQQSTYDDTSKTNLVTTQFKVGNERLDELTKEQKADLEKQLLELAQYLNKEMQSITTSLMFDYEDSISSLVLTIKQRDSGEIIRKIPTDEAMELMKKMRDIISVIFDAKG
ncbi:flagellar protein FlaG [Helicobacter sp. 23-1045]